ncbi:MAG: hypothetical protein M0C28_20230 [Candidatus Moduliflexus flocculans]|nr:hypothetical protein [Candidatus Moduliflexus flocculans]
MVSNSATRSWSGSSSARTTRRSQRGPGFTNVRITVPAPADLVPYRDYLGAAIELLDVDTGLRTTVFRSDRPIQAPNWTKDGRFLIYNADGLLHRLELATGKASKLDTGFATANNNDHVLSFDGKRLGISHHSAADGDESAVYVLPSRGGTPKRVTAKAPSYLHGWSPDGRSLVYTGGRDGNYDVYRIPFEGGDEVRLTDAPALDDGPGIFARRPASSISIQPGRPRCRSGGCPRTEAARNRSRRENSTTGSPTSRPTASGSSFYPS